MGEFDGKSVIVTGGALGIGVADRLFMLEYTWFSVISPEGCASILWRSSDFKESAADSLKLTSTDMLSLGIIDEVGDEVGVEGVCG